MIPIWIERPKARSLVLSLLVVLSGCFSGDLNGLFERAVSQHKSQQYKEALDGYQRVIKREPRSGLAMRAARMAAEISTVHMSDYEAAAGFYQHIVVFSDRPKERKFAQKRLARLYFDKKQDFKSAIMAYHELLNLDLSNREKIQIKFRIAKSYFYLNQFEQAIIETEEALDLKPSSAVRFDLALFRGNVLLTLKRLDEAIQQYKTLLETEPKRSREENVALNLAVCFEEQNNFEAAIEVLQEMKEDYPQPEFVELKIQRLKKIKR